MGQKVNPLGFRIGITEDWKSRWYATKQAYGEFLGEDYRLRKFIDKKLNRKPPFAAVSDILIERTREEVRITLRTARPGLVIGPKGAEVDKLREEVEDLIKRKVAWSEWFKRNPWLVAFVLYCGLSTLWSDFPGIAIKRWTRAIGSLAIIVTVLTEPDPVYAISVVLEEAGFGGEAAAPVARRIYEGLAGRPLAPITLRTGQD